MATPDITINKTQLTNEDKGTSCKQYKHIFQVTSDKPYCHKKHDLRQLMFCSGQLKDFDKSAILTNISRRNNL